MLLLNDPTVTSDIQWSLGDIYPLIQFLLLSSHTQTNIENIAAGSGET